MERGILKHKEGSLAERRNSISTDPMIWYIAYVLVLGSPGFGTYKALEEGLGTTPKTIDEEANIQIHLYLMARANRQEW